MKSELMAYSAEYNLQLTEKQGDLLLRYMDLFLETNKKFNLSAIRDPQEVLVKHILDSLIIARMSQLDGIDRLLDLGTGGGFPGIPIKICYPNIKTILLDSVAKKLKFVKEAALTLGLKDLSFEHMRAEDAGHLAYLRDSQQVITARSVAYLPILVEYSLPLLEIGGSLVAAKLRGDGSELREAEKAIHILGGKMAAQHFYNLPNDTEQRQVLVVEKIRRTPNKYPRKPGLAKKTPII